VRIDDDNVTRFADINRLEDCGQVAGQGPRRHRRSGKADAIEERAQVRRHASEAPHAVGQRAGHGVELEKFPVAAQHGVGQALQ
jgi:hypothetical protein